MSSSHWGTAPPTASETVGGSPMLPSTNTDTAETNHEQGSSSSSKLSLGSFEIHSPPLGDPLSFCYDSGSISQSNRSARSSLLDLLKKATVEDPSGPSPYSYPASYCNGVYTVPFLPIPITSRTPVPIRALVTPTTCRSSAETRSTIRLPKTHPCSPCPPSFLLPFLRNPSTTLDCPTRFPSSRLPPVTPVPPSFLAPAPPSSLPSPPPIYPRRIPRALPPELPCLLDPSQPPTHLRPIRIQASMSIRRPTIPPDLRRPTIPPDLRRQAMDLQRQAMDLQRQAMDSHPPTAAADIPHPTPPRQPAPPIPHTPPHRSLPSPPHKSTSRPLRAQPAKPAQKPSARSRPHVPPETPPSRCPPSQPARDDDAGDATPPRTNPRRRFRSTPRASAMTRARR